ncbi:hypothetical protein LWI29_002217 [Acer saccharum]|uniref:Uncharacterized protein n=1 Tax=Acer saccharum TaxID=4024 RepID=A0AA39VEX4_ACESA|nr:hypothetical protein LWI29_002217 [Acer saccharum]
MEEMQRPAMVSATVVVRAEAVSTATVVSKGVGSGLKHFNSSTGEGGRNMLGRGVEVCRQELHSMDVEESQPSPINGGMGQTSLGLGSISVEDGVSLEDSDTGLRRGGKDKMIDSGDTLYSGGKVVVGSFMKPCSSGIMEEGAVPLGETLGGSADDNKVGGGTGTENVVSKFKSADADTETVVKKGNWKRRVREGGQRVQGPVNGVVIGVKRSGDEVDQFNGKRRFFYERCWAERADCGEVIKQAWGSVGGHAGSDVVRRLSKCAAHLQRWNRVNKEGFHANIAVKKGLLAGMTEGNNAVDWGKCRKLERMPKTQIGRQVGRQRCEATANDVERCLSSLPFSVCSEREHSDGEQVRHDSEQD